MSKKTEQENINKNIEDKNENSGNSSDINEEIMIDKVNKKPIKNNQKKKDNLQSLTLQDEMKADCIKKSEPVNVVVKKKVIVKRYNENGERITKKGTVDQRGKQGQIQNTSRYKEILEKKKQTEKETKKVMLTPVVEDDTDSDECLDFEIETVENPIIKQEVEKRQKFDEEIFKLKQENEKLKENFHLNNHLSLISGMARKTKLKF